MIRLWINMEVLFLLLVCGPAVEILSLNAQEKVEAEDNIVQRQKL